jgi:NitT/TauT family transport system permease protein
MEASERTKLNFAQRLLYPLPMVVFIFLWHVCTQGDQQRQFIFSSPEKVWQALERTIISGELLTNCQVTITEAVAGFLLGTTIGAVIGLSLWYSKLVAEISKPYITALATVPIFALAPVIISWFGIDIYSKIALAFLSTVTVAIVQSYQGAMSVEKRFLRLMQVAGATRWQTFKFVVVPSSIIWVLNAMKLNIGLALMGAFIGEFISSEHGIGYMIVKASGLYDQATVFAGVIALIFIALALTFVIEQLENSLMKWKSV